jgi:predicted acyl esterase
VADPPFENFGLPYHPAVPESLDNLPAGEPTELVLDLEGTAIVIDAGHRLRITIAGADRANYELHPDPAGKDAPTLTIWRGGERASYVELPVLDGPQT